MIFKRLIISIILTLSFFTNVSFSKDNKVKIHKDEINGIYRVYDVAEKNLSYYYAICKDEHSQNFKIVRKELDYKAIYTIGASEPKIIGSKYDIRSWAPLSKDFKFYGIINKGTGSIKVQETEKPLILLLYFKIYKDTLSVAEFFMDHDDYETSQFGYKETDEFNIVDDKNNIIEVCKSR